MSEQTLSAREEQAVLDRFGGLRQHQQDGKRSPHKPLLVLAALGRLIANGSSQSRFSEVEQQLADLVSQFGRPSVATRATSAAYPFTRLRSDGVWVLDADVPMDHVGPLRESDVAGSFVPEVEYALQRSPALVRRLARSLVTSQFPPSIAGDVLAQAGLDPDWALGTVEDTSEDRRRTRSVVWVRDILHSWDRQCAFCGYDGQLGDSVVGLEAAHVRWFNMDGPDEVDNGLALCSLHHKLFDRGALGIDAEYRVKISPRFTARTAVGRRVYEILGRPLQPRPGAPLPALVHVAWHDAEVFKAA